MKTREHAFLRQLKKTKPPTKLMGRPSEACPLCQSCRGKCKTDARLIVCPGREKWGK